MYAIRSYYGNHQPGLVGPLCQALIDDPGQIAELSRQTMFRDDTETDLVGNHEERRGDLRQNVV